MKLIKKFAFINAAVNNHPLAKNHKVHVYYNILKWQLSQLFFPSKKNPFYIRHIFTGQERHDRCYRKYLFRSARI